MTGPGCHSSSETEVRDTEIVTLYADYRINTQVALDHCDVRVRAPQDNRRIRYYIETLTIFDCGIQLELYENPQNMNMPTVSDLFSFICLCVCVYLCV